LKSATEQAWLVVQTFLAGLVFSFSLFGELKTEKQTWKFFNRIKKA
jgi:hypothetical protein